MKKLSIKEVYLTIQGEGFHTGRPAVFIRFTGCNLWSGLEKDRKNAICNWCDTDFIGTDGELGGKYTEHQLANIVKKLWESNLTYNPYVILTGGEPLLQVNSSLLQKLHSFGFEIGLETNGTRPIPDGIDWVCVSPKSGTDIILKKGNELKFVYPQKNVVPDIYQNLEFDHFYIQPMDGLYQKKNTDLSKQYILKNTRWKLSLQTHKILGIP